MINEPWPSMSNALKVDSNATGFKLATGGEHIVDIDNQNSTSTTHKRSKITPIYIY
ncbi:hypothetical protein HYPSUDRAFT_60997 [Hypholoma sublateritium FD-334 SS-4]|uniref:Uncharacterized protein n=1 Tax=Hypholoma sublateritium (strain FD-334 SS-4) TaxID=945553 RepID=A0A0D2PH53_HYPSF|nr:hypothetical protein HYPSUDRAFT_60997 [Hypholoma sublateritium FD-334 SS-4]